MNGRTNWLSRFFPSSPWKTSAKRSVCIGLLRNELSAFLQKLCGSSLRQSMLPDNFKLCRSLSGHQR